MSMAPRPRPRVDQPRPRTGRASSARGSPATNVGVAHEAERGAAGSVLMRATQARPAGAPAGRHTGREPLPPRYASQHVAGAHLLPEPTSVVTHRLRMSCWRSSTLSPVCASVSASWRVRKSVTRRIDSARCVGARQSFWMSTAPAGRSPPRHDVFSLQDFSSKAVSARYARFARSAAGSSAVAAARRPRSRRHGGRSAPQLRSGRDPSRAEAFPLRASRMSAVCRSAGHVGPASRSARSAQRWIDLLDVGRNSPDGSSGSASNQHRRVRPLRPATTSAAWASVARPCRCEFQADLKIVPGGRSQRLAEPFEGFAILRLGAHASTLAPRRRRDLEEAVGNPFGVSGRSAGTPCRAPRRRYRRAGARSLARTGPSLRIRTAEPPRSGGASAGCRCS